ncbi:hypothetical protein U1Q18_042006 [Sarracenia purpurea var. burkii]
MNRLADFQNVPLATFQVQLENMNIVKGTGTSREAISSTKSSKSNFEEEVDPRFRKHMEKHRCKFWAITVLFQV